MPGTLDTLPGMSGQRVPANEVNDNGVLVLAGPPCAGKSSVGHVLAEGARGKRGIYLEVDSLFSLLLPDSDRNRSDRMLAYDAAHALARLLLERGHTPMLECTYARREQRASLVKAMADAPGAPLWVVELFVSPDDAVRRFRSRDQPTDLDQELVRERAEAFPYSDQALRIESTAAPPEEQAHQIATWLEQRPASVDRDRWAAAGRGWD
jgi:predicted kinase